MSGNYALTFDPIAQRQIEDLLVGSRVRQWREESVARLNLALKDDPMELGEGRESDAFRLWFSGGFAVGYHVDESAKRVTVLSVHAVE